MATSTGVTVTTESLEAKITAGQQKFSLDPAMIKSGKETETQGTEIFMATMATMSLMPVTETEHSQFKVTMATIR